MKKKLIEVALPLDAINEGSKPETENPFLRGHPRAIHNWWARTPLSVCRAVLFSQLVDDPSCHPDRFPTMADQVAERARLLDLVGRLATWSAVADTALLDQARREIRGSASKDRPIGLLDPFAGRGSIPLEGQRLGMDVYASDLNPIAVLINKALIEIPPRFADMAPVHPTGDTVRQPQMLNVRWVGTQGLAEDVRYYGKWIRDESAKRIGHLYPKVGLSRSHGGGEATVMAWLWARTVTCPNPACRAQMPLVRSFSLSTKAGKQAWVEPTVDNTGAQPQVRFEVMTGRGKPRDGTVNRRGATCICCGSPVPFQYLRAEGKAGRIEAQLMSIVAESQGGRTYVAPIPEHESTAKSANGGWKSDGQISHWPGRTNVVEYGMTTFGDLFTDRQLVALTTFSDLVREIHPKVERDAQIAGLSAQHANDYADAMTIYLACSVSRLTDYSNALCSWNPTNENVRNLFQRQAIPMVWDFAEANISLGKLDMETATGWIAESLTNVPAMLREPGSAHVSQVDARDTSDTYPTSLVISTDPPYYDNIGYADLSDFFYVWLRRSLVNIVPDLFSTLLTPKSGEMIASPYRHGGSADKARDEFRDRFERVFRQMGAVMDPGYPMTVYYAFRQEEEEEEDEGRASTGWETMLEGLVSSGLQITGTWPVRTTKKARSVARDTNALASAVVIVCRPQVSDAAMIPRRGFLGELRNELPAALRTLQQGYIAPVDLAQASIGPGMAIFSRYSRVVEADGSPMSVRTALALINQALDEYLAEQEGEYDADTRWAVAWFEQHGFDDGVYGDAETLSKAKNTAVAGMVEAGFLYARAGKVRLLRREELDPEWTPAGDKRRTVWEVTQHLIHALQSQGEDAAAALLVQLPGGEAEAARDLAYRLYSLCERKGWAQEAIAYNSLVVAWPDVQRRAQERSRAAPVQGRLGM